MGFMNVDIVDAVRGVGFEQLTYFLYMHAYFKHL